DKSSSGLILSEGAGMVVLKRFEDAIRDNDKILALISGIGLSNDGHGKYFVAPNPRGQFLSFSRAYENSDITPNDIDYIECHATGTHLGDITEVSTIENFFGQYQASPLIGSLKSNIGYFLTASGMASITKTILGMKKSIIPSSLSQNPLNSKVVTSDISWPKSSSIKRAAINSFGFGGTNAHLILEEVDQNILSQYSNSKKDFSYEKQEMHIIGMDAHFGACTNLEQYYISLLEGKKAFTKKEDTRWKGLEINESNNNTNLNNTKEGAYVNEFEIDTLEYKILPNEVSAIHPQQTLMLKVADQALLNAGFTKEHKGRNIAVIVAMEFDLSIHQLSGRWDITHQLNKWSKDNNIELPNSLVDEIKNKIFNLTEENNTASLFTGFIGNITASRISNLWDFTGPALSVSCGEQSFYAALEIAQMWLSSNQVEAVVIGSVDLAAGLERTLTRKSILDGNEINGEGAGAIVLTSASEINQKNYSSYAIIKDINKINEDINSSVELIEISHNPHEHKFKANEQTTISSVHYNIGSTYSASGIASIIKAALCLHYRFIPENNNEWIKSRPWFNKNRLAIVSDNDKSVLLSSVSINTNSNLKEKTKDTYLSKAIKKLIFVSGNNLQELQQNLSALEIQANEKSLMVLADKSYQFTKNKKSKYLLSLIADNKEKLHMEIASAKAGIIKSFEDKIIWKTPFGSYFTPEPIGDSAKIAFMYPGAMKSYVGLGQNFFQMFPMLFEQLQSFFPDIDKVLSSKFLYPRNKESLKEFQNFTIERMFIENAFSLMFTKIMESLFIVKPKAAFGYCMGESSTMLYCTGVWNVNNRSKIEQSNLFKDQIIGKMNLLSTTWNCSYEEMKKNWSNMFLFAPLEDVESLIKQFNDVCISFINTPKEVIISGKKDSCQKIIDRLKCQTLNLPFDTIIHTDYIRPVYNNIFDINYANVNKRDDITLYSGITFGVLPIDSESIARNSADIILKVVDFPQITRKVYDEGYNVFIELGVDGSCSRFVSEILKNKKHLSVSFDNFGKPHRDSLLELLAKLASNNITVNLKPIFSDNYEETNSVDLNLKNNNKLIKKVIIGGNNNFSSIISSPTQNTQQLVLDTKDLIEFAEGKVSNVLGNEYSIIDSYNKRIRLPARPYLFVDKITKIEVQRNQIKPAFIQSEYTIPNNSWYSSNKQLPFAIISESGQAFLLLLSYMGIDFGNKGEKSFRVLEGSMEFFDTSTPLEGDVLKHDIRISSFTKTSDILMFFFNFDCYVNGKFCKVKEGCGGFFSQNNIDNAQGIVLKFDEKEEIKNAIKKRFIRPLECDKKTFSFEDIKYLSTGDFEKCFNDLKYFKNNLNPLLKLPPSKLLMIDRVTKIENDGGPWGLGYVEAEKDIHKDDWFFKCHFSDDNVMPASLQNEGAFQLLQFYMLYCGLQNLTKDATFEYISNITYKMRTRKQVIAKNSKIIYRMYIKDICLLPKPKMVMNIEIIYNNDIILYGTNCGLELKEKDADINIVHKNNNCLFNEIKISEVTLGNLSNCLGKNFSILDGRKSSRIPCKDLQMLDRVLNITGEFMNFNDKPTMISEFDVKANTWYLKDNSYPQIPYSIFLEIALQASGNLGVSLGANLIRPEVDTFTRNLDGDSTFINLPDDFRAKTIKSHITLLSSSTLHGQVIQNYKYVLSSNGEDFFIGNTVFGIFPKEALMSNAGLDQGTFVKPWYLTNNYHEKLKHINLDDFTKNQMNNFNCNNKPHYNLTKGQLKLLNELWYIKDEGGKFNKGYIYAKKQIKPYDWFFKYHFYGDPVMPGSLGIEAMVSAMQSFVLLNDLGKDFKSPHFTCPINNKTSWKYRGQILPDDKEMSVEIHLKEIRYNNNSLLLIADGSLWKDSLRIYQVTDLGILLKDNG
ncbi:MAG: hypothetical protein HQK51_10960, partial [Oligoflexia bacterium]|nr:hypothetical protein [Oligoflexia bacterium]